MQKNQKPSCKKQHYLTIEELIINMVLTISHKDNVSKELSTKLINLVKKNTCDIANKKEMLKVLVEYYEKENNPSSLDGIDTNQIIELIAEQDLELYEFHYNDLSSQCDDCLYLTNYPDDLITPSFVIRYDPNNETINDSLVKYLLYFMNK